MENRRMISYEVKEFGKPLERSEKETPTPVKGQVLVKVQAAGVCHTDVHARKGWFDLGGGKRLTMADRGVKLPLTLGHEIAGEVVAVGPDADPALIGQRCVVYPWVGCGQCKVCKRGSENLCLSPRVLGIFEAGGYSDHVLVPDTRYLVDIGDIPAKYAAPCACSGLTMFSAINKIDPAVVRDEHVIVYGAGGLGLMSISLLRALGGKKPIVIEPDGSRRTAALRAGALEVFDSNAPDLMNQVKAAAGGAVWAILDCVGSETTVSTSLAMLTKGGTLVQVGLYGGKIDLPTPTVPMRALNYQGCYVGSIGQLRALVDLLKAGSVETIPVTTRPLEEAESALSDLEEGKVVGRLMLEP
jgi:alcohol dehydrogenase, propanol-preferring